MVATSQPLATRAGLRILEQGGNAVDAAIAAAAVLCVTEPMSTGIGGDCFAVLWHDGELIGLDAAGPAPARAEPTTPVEQRGPRSVTVPGAVGGWAMLSERYGRLGLDHCLQDAIAAASNGFAVAPVTAAVWAQVPTPDLFSPAPRLGQRFRQPELATTLRAIAQYGPTVFYGGAIGRAIAEATWLEEDDLATYSPRWVEPLRLRYRSVEVVELPPPTQGVVALEGLGLLERGVVDLPGRIHSVRLALEDGLARVRDGADVSDLIDPSYLDRRAVAATTAVAEPPGGTVYLCAVDGDRMAVSFIQSLYERFGSLVVAPGTGVVLQNRGGCFAVNGAVEPGRRPYHTIIPGMLLRNGELLGPFGLMGGFIQAQSHVQFVSALVDDGLDPQAAIDRPRFRVEGELVRLERGLWDADDDVRAAGLEPVRETETGLFGGGQAILVEGDALVGGSDPRKDGYAAGF
jgi:gamma-glutamyltranspeptidase/glutathione hydrolase